MSTHHRLRPHSPPHHRDPLRASTGNVYATSYDTVSSGHSARSSVSNAPSHGSTITPIRQTIHPDGKKTEYLVRPRHNSTTAQETKRPLSISTTRNVSPPRRGSRVSASPREIVSAGLPREDVKRLLAPSSALVPRQHASHHQRHNSASRADVGSFDPYRHRKDRLYHVRGAEPQKQYYVSRSQPTRQAKDEDWEYTGPRQQFARDYPLRPRRESHSRRERPSAAHESDREYSPRKSHGHRSSLSRYSQHVDRVPTERHLTRSGFDSDPDRPNETSRRHQSLKAPAVLHQNLRDEGYSSSRDDYETRAPSHKYDDDGRRNPHRRREIVRDLDRDQREERERKRDHVQSREYDHRRHRQPRSRDPSPERSHMKDIAAGTLGSLATAGALTTFVGRDSKDKDDVSEEEDKDRRHDRRRRHKKEDQNGYEFDDRRRSDRREESSSESVEEKPRRRRHSRRRQDDDELGAEQLSGPQRAPRPRSVSRVRPENDDRGRGHRDYDSNHAYDDEYRNLDARTISPGENEDDRPRKVMLVEPERKEDVKPKGILKPARQVPFPEDPNPIREGVAPLKDAKKDGGVPVNARWTKISRVLVNPEALEKANERFEERDDYVVVLRVVTREEIQKLADKTNQIRDAREREWQKIFEEQKRSQQSNGHESDFTDGTDDEDRPLAIEAAPTAPSADLRNLAQSQQQSQQYQSQAAAVPDIHVSESYSHNV